MPFRNQVQCFEINVSSRKIGNMDLNQIQDDLAKFAQDRDWGQFHSVRNLSLALMGEVGELAELLQWVDDNNISEFLAAGGRDRLGEELADVLFYLVRVADVAGVDLSSAVRAKLKENSLKYPVEKSKGNAKKYNELG